MQRNRHLASKRGKFPQYVFAMGRFYGCELINWAGRSDQGQPREASRASHSSWRSEKSIELSDRGTNALVVARAVAGNLSTRPQVLRKIVAMASWPARRWALTVLGCPLPTLPHSSKKLHQPIILDIEAACARLTIRAEYRDLLRFPSAPLFCAVLFASHYPTVIFR